MHVEDICDIFIQMSEYQGHDYTNFRILFDVKLFTCKMLHINTVPNYCQKVCEYGQFIHSVTFENSFLPNRKTKQIF